ncbi:MAG: hypothetical protein ACTSPB_04095 [Candidatus Thorarchaeota archaeon]
MKISVTIDVGSENEEGVLKLLSKLNSNAPSSPSEGSRPAPSATTKPIGKRDVNKAYKDLTEENGAKAGRAVLAKFEADDIGELDKGKYAEFVKACKVALGGGGDGGGEETTEETPEESTEETITKKDAKKALMDLIGENGKKDGLKALKKHKVEKLSELDESNYAAFVQTCSELMG